MNYVGRLKSQMEKMIIKIKEYDLHAGSGLGLF